MDKGPDRGRVPRENARADGDEFRRTAARLARRPSVRLAATLARRRRRIHGHPPAGSVLEATEDAGNSAELLQGTLELAAQRSVRFATWLANLRLRIRGRPPMGSLLDPLIDGLLESAPARPPAAAPSGAAPAGKAAPKATARVDIVLLISGAAARLAPTLEGLDGNLGVLDGVLVLVDDGADDEAMALAQSWARERGLAVERIEGDPASGMSRALRRAIEAGDASAVLVLGAGGVPLPGACAALLDELEARWSATAVSGLRVPVAPAVWTPAALTAAAADDRLGLGTTSPLGAVRPVFCVLRRAFLEDHALVWFVRERWRAAALRGLVAAARDARRAVLQSASAVVLLAPDGGGETGFDPHERRLALVLGELATEPSRATPVIEAALERPLRPVVVGQGNPADGVRAGLRALGVEDGEGEEAVALAFDLASAVAALAGDRRVVLHDSGGLRDEPAAELAAALRAGQLRVTAPTYARRMWLEELGWPVAGLVPVYVPSDPFEPRGDDPLLGAVRCVVVRTGRGKGGPDFARSLGAALGPGVTVLTLGPPPRDATAELLLTRRSELDDRIAAETLGVADLFVDLGVDDLCGTWTARALCCGTPALALKGSSAVELVRGEPALFVRDRGSLGTRIAELLADHHRLLELRQTAEALAERHRDVSVAARMLAVASFDEHTKPH